MRNRRRVTAGRPYRRAVLAAVIMAFITGGCSSVPDAVNPVEWYKGARDWIAGDENPETANNPEAKPVPGADKPFPKLDSVPDRQAGSTAAEREQMANSLVADRERARYSDEQIRRQSGSVAAGTLPRPSASGSVPGSDGTSTSVASSTSGQTSVPPSVRTSPVAPPPQAAMPATSAVGQAPTIPNQPIPVVPDPPPENTGLPRGRLPVQQSADSFVPPPPPTVIGGNGPSTDDPELPPSVNPAGGGPDFGQPVPPIRQDPGFVGADRFAPRFPNPVRSPQQSASVPTPSATAQLDQGQAFQPGTPPVATILFGDGSARIGRGDRQVIRRVYDDFRVRGGRLHIVGHASSRTRNLDQASHQLANFRISFERARAVAEIFERLGVPPESIVVTAMSDQQPNYFEVMPAGEAGNRRVEIFFEN